MIFSLMIEQFVRDHPIMLLAWVVVLILLIAETIKTAKRKFKAISNNEAVALVNGKAGLFVDLRGESEFNKGHIIDSIQVSATDIKNDNLKELSKFKNNPVILVDNTGFVSEAAAQHLVNKGFVAVYILKEGLHGWKSANFPTVSK